MTHSYLSEAFLSQFVDKAPEFKGSLYPVISIGKYAQYVHEEHRRETWLETVARAVNYNVGLHEKQKPGTLYSLLEKEAEAMFSLTYNLQAFPSGRSLWVGGTKGSSEFGESCFNCATCIMDELEAIGDLFWLLIVGSGVGFRILKSDVAKLPKFKTDFTISHREYNNLPKDRRLEHTVEDYGIDGNRIRCHIGDSKKGWVTAFRLFLKHMTEGPVSHIEFVYDSIRPKGERLMTFGGRAPGPEGLQHILTWCFQVIQSSGGKLRPIHVLDINNIIAYNVHIGGNRRASEIGLGSPDDIEFIEAKKDFWQSDLCKTRPWRIMSNNSIVFEGKPTRQQMESIFTCIMSNGEPGFFNLDAARKRRADCDAANPCMEILLKNRGVCNLSTLNVNSFVQHNSLQIDELLKAVRLITRIGVRQTCATLSLPRWDAVQKKDRLTGVSMTGFMDAMDKLGWEFDSPQAISTLQAMREAANREATSYSELLGIPRPLLCTAVKPEGSISLMPVVSPGMHRSYAPYYLRRVRYTDIDPICKALIASGVPYHRDKAKPDRIVFEFPIKSAAPIACSDEPALRQLQRYYVFQENYVDHNTSCTITFDPEEAPALIDMMLENWDNTVAVALLVKNTKSHPSMPLQKISKSTYYRRNRLMPDLTKLIDSVNLYEREEFYREEEDAVVECSSGACPIR